MTESAKFRVLFVCIGNSCRSPMAEAIARARCGDVIEPFSAGLAPAPIIQPMTLRTLAEIGVQHPAKSPVPLKKADWKSMDVVVNISGSGILPFLKGFEGALIEWDVIDPIGQSVAVYRAARDRIAEAVEDLAAELRKQRSRPDNRG